LSLSVCVSLIASLALSFTLVPVLFKYLMRSMSEQHQGHSDAEKIASKRRKNPFSIIHERFEHGFNVFRETYRDTVSWALSFPLRTVGFFLVLMAVSLVLFPGLGEDFFPQVDAGQMRLHVRAPPGTRIEQTQAYFAQVEGGGRRDSAIGWGRADRHHPRQHRPAL
jgi:multidrug efflux pump subunit AcrB